MRKTSDSPVAEAGRSLLRAATRRRDFLARMLGLGAGALALGGRGRAARAQVAPIPGVNDAAILNFALNFEYLGSEFYTYGLTGNGIEALGLPTTGTGTLGPITVRPSPQVAFATPMIRQFITELARDEQAHVLTVRAGLASLGATPIARPAIDLNNSFRAALGATFDVYANENNFLLGGYILEDTCVSALHGAAPLITSRAILNTAAGLLGVEGYQAGAIRTILNQRGFGGQTQAISATRASLGGSVDFGVSQGPLGQGPAGSPSIILADANALAPARTPRQVLNIAYLAANAAAGGFFPNGVNGPLQG